MEHNFMAPITQNGFSYVANCATRGNNGKLVNDFLSIPHGLQFVQINYGVHTMCSPWHRDREKSFSPATFCSAIFRP